MTVTMVAQGVLRPDGMIELIDPVDLPLEPRPVTVTLTEPQASAVDSSKMTPRLQREPGGIWFDESIPAPFDLPRPGTPQPVKVEPGGVRLPDPGYCEFDDT